MKFELAHQTTCQIATGLKEELGLHLVKCGSLALGSHGLLVREVGDLDLMPREPQVNDNELIAWVERHGRWPDSATKDPRTTLKVGRLSFFFQPRAAKNRKPPQNPAIKVEFFLPDRYPFKIKQGLDVIDFTYREIGRDPLDSSMWSLSPDACILWKLLMGRVSDMEDLSEIRDRALLAGKAFKLNDIERLIEGVDGRDVLWSRFREVFRPNSWIGHMSGDADTYGAAAERSRAGAM